MKIWGKIVGGTAGFALGGPIAALLGVMAGHAVDQFVGQQASDGTEIATPADPRDHPGLREIAFFFEQSSDIELSTGKVGLEPKRGPEVIAGLGPPTVFLQRPAQRKMSAGPFLLR